ncbi:Nucleosome assembly protein 1-like 4 [Gracilariopsis chorda]|uniref:Nucleosome assembly protein 1-like 4 n=1 Tax=Gracilariopsis chorda TaxID=448386 RepID=A0A2V3J526_9FLOR|nr:Nucleosome assembly protein 1-like 4 [Gracilariopsis chorda]|eukprot:PXF49222.1 Nucleosome assembly protein 1-like 4 [Gracilariopsis chorda]
MSSHTEPHEESQAPERSEALSDRQLSLLAPDLFDEPEKKASLLALRDLHRNYDSVYQQYIQAKIRLEETYVNDVKPIMDQRKQYLDRADIYNFWSCVFDNCDTLRDNITMKDAAALRYLTDVSCETKTINTVAESPLNNPDWPVGSFVLRFRFRHNPYFEDQVLTKAYVMCDHDFEHPSETIGCSIVWKPGKDLTVKTLRKKTQNGKILVRKQSTDSFFNFFKPPKLPDEDDEEVDPTLVEEIEEVLDADFEIAECLRDDVIPRALLYFLDVANQSECYSNHDSSEEQDVEDRSDNDGDDADVDDDADAM